MGKKLYLVFWWHMHQPPYEDPETGLYVLPWTFLHALKDYYEMPWHLSRFPTLKANFNLVPVLLDQLEAYAQGRARDPLLEILEKPRLSETEKDLLHTLIALLPEPLKRREPLLLEPERSLEERREAYLRVWCGEAFRERHSEALQEGGAALLEAARRFLAEIPGYYRRLWEEGRLGLSLTPYYHPLLPLLLDPSSARENDPEVPLPALEPFPETAEMQVHRALARFGEIFGQVPRAVWPAEGAVSRAAVELLSRSGARILATDESLLWAALGGKDPPRLYRRFRFGETVILFRDQFLSDRIGFAYQHWAPEAAVEEFLGRLREIYETVENPVVTVLLDGENCWEYYPENGFPFRELLYRRLSETPWIETLTLEEVLSREELPEEDLPRLKAGSWIFGNFRKWLGHPAKNRAWELLGQAGVLLRQEGFPEKAREYFLRAEGSDWFWWYGEGLTTPLLDRFDHLFRANLRRVYRELGRKGPSSLDRPW
ncbi:glycoside hydrolase [Thermosulfurimonas marina]|uniref:Glycoside hydrolase n=1 Tax=Thermosulfurimonas marina TaxID=2047767 RepID=A0A6H1WT93_9BACT|nr:glycoside hydrolase family 57 protein [Thermosulfurimonas marina]QJA06423.1 glycoside hydrolase [Thermosulfurimonas marina]